MTNYQRWSFVAYTEDGTEMKIEMRRPSTQTLRLGDNSPSKSFGAATFRTSHGQPVTYLSKGRYHIEETGEQLTSDDPNAP
jgi:hypothetical protein